MFQIEQNAILFGKTSENFTKQRSISARHIDNERRTREVIILK